MKYVTDEEPGRLVFRPPCCEQKHAADRVLIVPPHGIEFFQELESDSPGTLAELHFRDPVPTHICTGCYQKLFGVVYVRGQKVRFMRKPDAAKIVWHDALPIEMEARLEFWESRVGSKRQKGAPGLPSVANSIARSNVPQRPDV